MLGCCEPRSDLLSALSAFVNTVLAGLCPKEVSPFFFGGWLIALDKTKIRWRSSDSHWLGSETDGLEANKIGIARLPSYFTQRQFGVGTSGGCEAAIHSARRLLSGDWRLCHLTTSWSN